LGTRGTVEVGRAAARPDLPTFVAVPRHLVHPGTRPASRGRCGIEPVNPRRRDRHASSARAVAGG
jgi:hypothetical protein